MRKFCMKPVKKWKGAVDILKEITYIFECNPSRQNFHLKRRVTCTAQESNMSSNSKGTKLINDARNEVQNSKFDAS